MAYENWVPGTLSWRQDIGTICFGERKASIKYNQPIMAQLPTMSKFQKRSSGHVCSTWIACSMNKENFISRKCSKILSQFEGPV